MTTRTRTGLVTMAAVTLTAIGMLLGPGQGGAVERQAICDSVGGQLGCICPDGTQVKLGPTFDGEGEPITYGPDQIAAACGDGTTSTTTSSTTTTSTTTTSTTTTSTTTTSTTTTAVPAARVAGEVVTALPAFRPTASAGATTNRAPASTAATISFTG